MAVKKVRAVRIECDGCGKHELVESEEEYSGFRGTVLDTDQEPVMWVAHNTACVSKAVRTAYERAHDDRKPTPSATLILADDVCSGSGQLVNENMLSIDGKSGGCPVCQATVTVTSTGKARKHTPPTVMRSATPPR